MNMLDLVYLGVCLCVFAGLCVRLLDCLFGGVLCLCVYVCVFVCLFVCLFAWLRRCLCVWLCECLRVWLFFVCVGVCLRVYVCVII